MSKSLLNIAVAEEIYHWKWVPEMGFYVNLDRIPVFLPDYLEHERAINLLSDMNDFFKVTAIIQSPQGNGKWHCCVKELGIYNPFEGCFGHTMAEAIVRGCLQFVGVTVDDG